MRVKKIVWSLYRHDATKLQVCALHVVCSSIKGNVAVYKVLNIETRYNTTDGQYAYVWTKNRHTQSNR